MRTICIHTLLLHMASVPHKIDGLFVYSVKIMIYAYHNIDVLVTTNAIIPYHNAMHGDPQSCAAM